MIFETDATNDVEMKLVGNEDYDDENQNENENRDEIKKPIAKWKVATAAVASVGTVGIIAGSVAYATRKKKQHDTKPASSPTSTPSVTATPSVTSSVTPSSSASITPTSSVTPTASTSKTPSASRTPSRTATPSRTPSRTPSSSTSPSRTPSRSPSVTPSVTPSPVPDISNWLTYEYALNVTSGVHSIWLRNNHPNQTSVISQISLRTNFMAVPKNTGLFQGANPTVNISTNSDGLSYSCQYTSNLRMEIASNQSARIDYSSWSTPIYQIAMNPTDVRVNNQTIEIDGFVPRNQQISSQVQPAIEYSFWNAYVNGSYVPMPYAQVQKIFYSSSSIFFNQESGVVDPYVASIDKMLLPDMGFNRLKYDSGIETYLALGLSYSFNATWCDSRSYLWNTMNSTMQAYAIGSMVNATKVWQLTGLDFFVEPCPPGTALASFFDALKPAFDAAGKKISIHLPGELTEIQNLEPGVICSIASKADSIALDADYWNETETAAYSSFQSPLNRIQNSLNYYKNLGCIPDSKVGITFPSYGEAIFVSSLENNGFGQEIVGFPPLIFENHSTKYTDIISWRCNVERTPAACGFNSFVPIPSDATFIASDQNSNGHEAWAFSSTLQNVTDYLYYQNITMGYWVMTYQDVPAAIAKANFAIQNNLAFVAVGDYAADLPAGNNQSLFQNVYNTLTANQTQNNTQAAYAERYYVTENQQQFQFVIPAHVVKTIENILTELPRESIYAIQRGIAGYLMHRISRQELTNLMQSYGCDEQKIYWLNYALSQTITFAASWYYSGDFVYAMKSTLTFAGADLYLQHVVGLSVTQANMLVFGGNLGMHAANSLPRAVNTVVGAAGSMFAQVLVETGLNICSKVANVASTTAHRFFKAAKSFIAEQQQPEAIHNNTLSV